MGRRAVRILDWYRADPAARMRRVLIIGSATLTLGGVVIAVSFLTRQPRAVRVDAVLAGIALVAGGAAFTSAGMQRILREDAYVAIRTDGVALRSGGRDATVLWDELERARWDAARAELVLERRDGAAHAVPAPFAGIDGPALAERIEHERRRAALGLMR